MMRCNIKVSIPIDEVNGKEVSPGDKPELVVRSHWNNGRLVVLEAPEAGLLTVVGDELVCAIEKASGRRADWVR